MGIKGIILYRIKSGQKNIQARIADLEQEVAEHRYGPITGTYVLYRGDSMQAGDVQYQRVEEYLKDLRGPEILKCTFNFR